MGERELQEALRSKAQERVRRIWRDAEEEVAAARSGIDGETHALRQEAERQVAANSAASRRYILSKAALEVRQQRLAAENTLQERMHALALRLLSTLAAGQRRRLWLALVAELPAADWRLIRVHPDDLVVAREIFPSAEAIPDAALIGGVVAETGDGRLIVDNSLAGRLERTWAELQAPLFAAINEEVDTDAAGTTATV